MELTERQKAWVFELVDLIDDIAIEGEIDPDQLVEDIGGFADDKVFVKEVLMSLNRMGWSTHREH